MITLRAGRLRIVVGVLALLGLLVAIYLTLYYLKFAQTIVCPGGGCDKVRASPWAYLFGVVPMPTIGLIGYGLILGVDLKWMARKYVAGTRVPVGLALLGMAGFGFLFSLFLTYLETFVIAAFCFWCATSAVLMTAIFVLSVWAWQWTREPMP